MYKVDDMNQPIKQRTNQQINEQMLDRSINNHRVLAKPLEVTPAACWRNL
jgi:hypothetical protein